jgi:hypothetical protein
MLAILAVEALERMEYPVEVVLVYAHAIITDRECVNALAVIISDLDDRRYIVPPVFDSIGDQGSASGKCSVLSALTTGIPTCICIITACSLYIRLQCIPDLVDDHPLVRG